MDHADLQGAIMAANVITVLGQSGKSYSYAALVTEETMVGSETMLKTRQANFAVYTTFWISIPF